MSAFLLSIVTVTRNDPVGLARTLTSSARFRALAGVEHCVVDASDFAPETVAADVRLLKQASRGIAAAFNEGTKATTGSWIWFLNGGDAVHANLDEYWLLELLKKSRSSVVVGGTLYESEGSFQAHPPPALQWPSVRSWIPHPSTLVRRELFTKFGEFDERYGIAMDYEWWLRSLSKDVSVDVLSVPFSVFSAGGVSQRSESLRTITRERDDALRRHQHRLWKSYLGTGFRFLKIWLRAVFARRLNKNARLP